MTTWGYILDMPGRPKPAEQRRALAAFGVDMSAKGACWRDKIDKAKRHATAGRTQLEERNALLAALVAGDRLVVASPTCLGVSAQDAEWFIGRLADRGVSLTVNCDLQQLEPGEDATHLLSEVARLIRNANVARSRGRSE